MKYDIEKLADILFIFAKNGQELTKLRICKLLYFIDKYHLQKYGRFVLGDQYNNLPYGPIPSLTLDVLDDFFSPTITFRGKPIKSSSNLLKNHFNQGQNNKKHPMLILKNNFIYDSLSSSEMEIITNVIKKMGGYTTGSLVNRIHGEATCRKTPVPHPIDPRLFLDDLPENERSHIGELMTIDEADEAATDCLNR